VIARKQVMTREEYTAAVDATKHELGEEMARLEERAKHARATLERCENKLAKIRQEFRDRLAKLSSAYVGIATDLDEPTSRKDESRNEIRTKQRVAPGALDSRVLEVASKIGGDDYTIADVYLSWHTTFPNEAVSRSTIRSVLERHKGTAVEVTHEGGAGRSNPRRYRSMARAANPTQLRAL
jgi:glutathione S-transferase